jgi:hypothetical protein
MWYFAWILERVLLACCIWHHQCDVAGFNGYAEEESDQECLPDADFFTTIVAATMAATLLTQLCLRFLAALACHVDCPALVAGWVPRICYNAKRNASWRQFAALLCCASCLLSAKGAGATSQQPS